MPKKCEKCGGSIWRRQSRTYPIYFSFNGKFIHLNVPHDECDECFKQAWLEKVKLLHSLPQKVRKNPLFGCSPVKELWINWNSYFYLLSLSKEAEYNKIEDDLNSILVDVEFLSTEIKPGRYIVAEKSVIRSGHVNNDQLSPRLNGEALCFYKETDAIQYAKFLRKNSGCNLQVGKTTK